METARCELAAEFLADLRHLDTQLRDTKKKLAVAVRASGTTVTEIFGVGPVIAGTVIGDVADVSRFPGRDQFAAYNGTAPIEVSSGNRKTCRLSQRGNRRINHAIHMAAVTQIRHRHSDSRACYDKKVADGKTRKEALRCLKRRLSDAIYARLQADARHAAGTPPVAGPGGQPGNDSDSSAAGSHPADQLFGQATPDPAPPYGPPPRAGQPCRSRLQSKPREPYDNAHKEVSFWRRSLPLDVADRAAQIWVICAFLPAWRHAAPMLGRADERAFSSGLCRCPGSSGAVRAARRRADRRSGSIPGTLSSDGGSTRKDHIR